VKIFVISCLISIGFSQNIPCRDEPSSYDNGQFEFCWTDDVFTYIDQEFPKGTGVHFDEDGYLDWVFLPSDMTIQGIGCRGGGHSFMTGFHPNGKLRLAWLIDDQIIQEVSCAKFSFFKAIFAGIHGKNGGTSFWDNGQLKFCELSEDFKIDNQLYKKGTLIKFDELGRLIK